MSAGGYADFKTALGQYESGNNYGFVSSLQYLGRWQFSEESLKAAGFYQGDSTTARDYVGAWTPLAASFGVTSKASFLASPAAQDAALESWFRYVDNDIHQLGLAKYEGQTLNGVAITGSGLFAGTHLVGVWALKSFLESGGTNVPQDGYGTTVVTYLTNFGGYDIPFAFGHAGPDTLSGGGGADRLFGGGGDDSLSGGGGSNYLRGEDGNDTLAGGSGFDDIHGNKGDDRIDGGAGGGDWLVGGQGSDLITAHAGDAILYGNIGADTLNGGSGSEILRGGQDDDVIYGGPGNDWISGDRGSDTLSGGSGADLFNTFKGAGLDRVLDFHAAEGDRVRIEGGAYIIVEAGADTVVDLGDGDRLVLAGVKLETLPAGWII